MLYIFPIRLNSASELSVEIRKLRLFRSNVVCCFANKPRRHIQISPGDRCTVHHPSLSKWSTVCTGQEIGREHSILQYVTLTLDVYRVCHGVSCCVKMRVVLSRSESQLDGIDWIYVSQQILDAIKTLLILSFSILSSTYSNRLMQCKILYFLSPELWQSSQWSYISELL